MLKIIRRIWDSLTSWLKPFVKWVLRIVRGERILITYRVDPDSKTFRKDLWFARVSEAQAYSLGYIRGTRMLDDFKYAPFKTYVRFVPDPAPAQINTHETASTLFDYWRSNATRNFMQGMTTKKAMAPIETKQLIMIIVIAAAAAIGIAWMMM